jgi:catechol 2,3-dioxygenase-like lactoylglutathione lyase family enzyme
MGSRWHALVVDSTDPARLGRWWAEVLGSEVVGADGTEVLVGPRSAPADGGPLLCFSRRDDAKAGRNRLHLDLDPDDRDAEVERLVDMGARHVDDAAGDGAWMALADPEGNEFRVRRPATQPAALPES